MAKSESPQTNQKKPVPAVANFEQSAAPSWWKRIAAHPLRSMSVLAMIGASIAGGIVSLPFFNPGQPNRESTSSMLAEALQALDEGKLEHARNVAAELRLRQDIPEEDRGIPAFVLGSVMFQDATDEWQERERKSYFLMAARYLNEAHRAGFPQGREMQASYLLGKALHDCGRYGESLPHLNAAVEKKPEKAAEICRLLANAYLLDKNPNLAKAAEFNQRYLADPALSRGDRDAALLSQARITFELGQYAECQQQIAQFRPEAAGYDEVQLLHGRLQLALGDRASTDPNHEAEAANHYAQAREMLADAQNRTARNAVLLRQAQYLHGVSLRRLGDLLAAEVLLNRTRRSYLETSEGMAAGIEEAEIQHLLGNDAEALAVYRQVLRRVGDSPNHIFPWITDVDLRRRLEAVVAEYRQEPQFEMAADLLQSMGFAFPDARTVEMRAILHQDWGELLTVRAMDPAAKESAALRTESRLKHRQAGLEFGNLAKLRFATREYPNDTWRSAENYLRGQDYDSAVTVYKRHLDSQSGNGRPPALTRLGDCLLALNRAEDALTYVNECILFFPKDPFVYRARLIAAEANLELGRAQAAKDLLISNLENESLTPQSREWRDSLFALGRIHFLDGCHREVEAMRAGLGDSSPVRHQAGMKELESANTAFRDCISRLDEAIQREPDAEQAIESRYMLAMAHVASARLPKQRLEGINIETTRVALRRDVQRDLQAAISEFEALKSLLVTRQERGDLSPVESRILRNCYFGVADTLFDLDQYEDAVEAYSSATNRYQQEPEALEAYIQIAVCQRKLNRLADSRLTLEQAKLVLARMPAEAVFEKTTRYNRQEWIDVLGWLSSL